MKQDDIQQKIGAENPYKQGDDEEDKLHLSDTRKPAITLKTLNKLRKMKELRKFDLLKQQEFVQNMYATPVNPL